MGLFLPLQPDWRTRPAQLRQPRLRVFIFCLLGVFWLTGCETVGYYSQAASGQLKLLYQRQDVDDLLEEMRGRELSEPEQALMVQLELSQQILAFAKEQLDLEVGERYRSYVELDEANVVWNLFAAPELSLEAKTWCYPFVGCAPYRGYFAHDDALAYRERLQAEGYDTYLGGVAAYSTLGWFDDPLLSSFVHWPEANLADLLFHELAHSRVWVKGDVGFNEAFASFVGREGMRQWLLHRGDDSGYRTFLEARAARARFLELLQETRQVLDSIYQSEGLASDKRRHKEAALSAMRTCFAADAARYGGERYQRVVDQLNNALLVSVATYDDQVPVFAALFAQAGGQWSEFYTTVAALAELDADQRAVRMQGLGEGQITDAADDHRTQQIQCQALSGHGLDAHPAGAENDDIRSSGHG